MKWITMFALSMCSLLLLPGESFAQAAEAQKTPAKPTTKWKTLGDGARIQRLWTDDEYPEVAVLELSDGEYKEFIQDVASYLNKNKVFPKPVNSPAGPCAAVAAPNKDDGKWFIVISHDRTSNIYCGVIPEPSGKAKEKH